MSITAKFRINRDKVLIEIPEKNASQNKPNVIFFDRQEKQIFGIGVPEETIRSDFLKQGKEFSDNLKFGISFQHDDEDSAFFDLLVTEYYMAHLYFSKTPIPVGLDSINYDFQIEDYEKWNEQRKLSFEYTLQARLKALTVKVNGISREIPIQKRRAEKITRAVKDLLVPVGFLVALYLWFEKSNSVFDIILILIGLVATIFISYIVWATTANILLPDSYLSFVAPEAISSRENKLVKYLLEVFDKN